MLKESEANQRNDLSGFSGLGNLNEQEKMLHAEVNIGIEAEAFLQSTMGSYLIGVAEQELDIAKESLLEIQDPTTPEGRALWFEIKLKHAAAAGFKNWCLAAVNNGRNAGQQIEQLEQYNQEI